MTTTTPSRGRVGSTTAAHTRRPNNLTTFCSRPPRPETGSCDAMLQTDAQERDIVQPAPSIDNGNILQDVRPEQALRVHLLGVAGTGMGSFAGMLKAVGHVVSGSEEFQGVMQATTPMGS